jgi:hypothetical protein
MPPHQRGELVQQLALLVDTDHLLPPSLFDASMTPWAHDGALGQLPQREAVKG